MGFPGMETMRFYLCHGKVCGFSRDGNFVILFMAGESLWVFYLGIGTL